MEAQNLEKIETIQFEVSVELYCYKQSRFGNTHIEVVAVFHIYQVYRKRNFICRTFFFIGIYTIFNLKCSFNLIFQGYHFETSRADVHVDISSGDDVSKDKYSCVSSA